MHLEPLESRTFFSAGGNTVSVPIQFSAEGNLPGNFVAGHASDRDRPQLDGLIGLDGEDERALLPGLHGR